MRLAYLPELPRDVLVLGIDPSTTGMGIAVMQVVPDQETLDFNDGLGPQVVGRHRLLFSKRYTSRHREPERRLHHISHQMHRDFRDPIMFAKVVGVGIERPSMVKVRGNDAKFLLGAAWGTAYLALASLPGVQPEFVYPNVNPGLSSAGVGLKVSAKKDQRRRRTSLLLGVPAWYDVKDNSPEADEADAAAVAYYVAQSLTSYFASQGQHSADPSIAPRPRS